MLLRCSAEQFIQAVSVRALQRKAKRVRKGRRLIDQLRVVHHGACADMGAKGDERWLRPLLRLMAVRCAPETIVVIIQRPYNRPGPAVGKRCPAIGLNDKGKVAAKVIPRPCLLLRQNQERSG